MRLKSTPIIISLMTGKLRGIKAINSNPTTNNFCQKMQKCSKNVCSFCYSEKLMNGYRKNCKPAYEYNSTLLSGRMLSDDEIPTVKDDIYRFNAHGELINRTHAKNLHNFAVKNSECIIGWWTKRPNLLRGLDKLQNVNYIYSNPKIDSIPQDIPEGFDKVFSVYTKEYAEKNNIKINCKGSSAGGCRACMLCYSKNSVTHINEIVK